MGSSGARSGSQWQSWRHNLEYVDYVGAVVLVAIIIYLVFRWRSDRNGSGGEPAADVVSD